jgi:hypothetical protein
MALHVYGYSEESTGLMGAVPMPSIPHHPSTDPLQFEPIRAKEVEDEILEECRAQLSNETTLSIYDTITSKGNQ